MQTDATSHNIVACCWPTMLRPFALAFIVSKNKVGAKSLHRQTNKENGNQGKTKESKNSLTNANT